MKQETITYQSGNTCIKLTPDNGFKYITNGEIFSTEVYLGKNDSPNNWHDTNEEPPQPEEEQEVTNG